MQEFFKKDLQKIVILGILILIVLFGLTILDNKIGILQEITNRYF